MVQIKDRVINGVDVRNIISEKHTSDILNRFKDGKLHFVAGDLSEGLTEGLAVVKTRNNINISRNQIRKYLSDPLTNFYNLQQISEYLYRTSPHYFRLINYYSNLMRFDHYLCVDDTEEMPDSKAYMEVAHRLQAYHIRRQFPKIINELIKYGDIFLYKIESKDKRHIELIEIPRQWCEVDRIVDGIYRYVIYPDRIPAEQRYSIPQAIYQDWNWNGDDRPYITVDDNGVAFKLDGMGRNGFPMFAFMFDAILGLDETRKKEDVRDILDTIQIIHQKIPLRDNKQDLALSLLDIAQYHQAMSKAMPEGVITVTTPLEVDSIKMDRPKDTDIDKIERANRDIWNSSGTSDILFSERHTGADALAKSITVDEQLLKPIILMLEKYINWELKEYSMRLKVLGTSHFNYQDLIKDHKESLAFGGSRIVYLAMLGYDPVEIVPQLTFEQNVINIDSIMKPKATSHTMSQKGEPNNIISDDIPQEIDTPDTESVEEVVSNE